LSLTPSGGAGWIRGPVGYPRICICKRFARLPELMCPREGSMVSGLLSRAGELFAVASLQLTVASYSTTCSHAGYHARCEFPDHDARRVRIGRRNRGHDRGIRDAQAVNAAHVQLGVHHRLPALAHRARPHGMEIAQARLTSELRGVFPAHSLRWDYPALNQVEVCRMRREVEAQFDAGRQGIDVGLFRQKVWLDLERAIGLPAADPEIASAEGSHETREDGEGIRWDHVACGDLVRDQRHLHVKEHQIGPRKCGPTFPETRAASEIVIRGRQSLLCLKAQAPYPDMVLEVSADARQIDEGLDAEMLEVSMWT